VGHTAHSMPHRIIPPGSIAGRRHQQACGSSNQVTVRPPHRRHPHRAARPATSCSPRPPSASQPAGRSSGVPGPARSVTSTRTTPSPSLTATVTISPAAPEPLYRTELPKISLTSKTATSPHGCPGPSTSPTNERAARARSARQASRSPRPPPSPSPHPPFPARPAPGNRRGSGRTQEKCTLSSAANVKPRTGRLPRTLVRGPSVVAAPVRGRPCKADGPPHRSPGPDSRPLTCIGT